MTDQERAELNKVFKKDEINKLRQELGMSLIATGNRRCLRCDKSFFSTDLTRNKVCDYCNERRTNKQSGYDPTIRHFKQ